jgi:hypothetical protein
MYLSFVLVLLAVSLLVYDIIAARVPVRYHLSTRLSDRHLASTDYEGQEDPRIGPRYSAALARASSCEKIGSSAST